MLRSPCPGIDVDLYVDFCCPWCLIGMARTRRTLNMLRGELDVRVAIRPFLLDPAAPDGGVDVHQKLRDKHGVRPEDVFPRIEAEARSAGIVLDLMRQPMAYASQRAHALVMAASAKGTALDLADAILTAYFIDLAPIDRADVLAGIAARHGFEPGEAEQACDDAKLLNAVARQSREAIDLGVRSVPTMMIAGNPISASNPPDRLAAALRRHAASGASRTSA